MPPDESAVPRHEKTPSSVDVSVTGGCNLSCRYCFYADRMASLKDLSTAEWEEGFRRLGEARVMRVTLTGGEPFSRPDFFSLVDAVIVNRMRYSILTNGTLIDRRVMEALGTGRRRLRLDSIQVSIDGSCAEVHDRSRPGSFHRAVEGLKLMRRDGLPVTVRVTISRHNMHDLREMARFLLDGLNMPYFSCNEASPVGAGCTCADEVALDHADTLRAGLELEELSRTYPGRIKAEAGPLAKLRMYREMEEARRTGEMTRRWKMGHLSSCGGVFCRMGVLHDGSMVPCSMLHQLVMGNLLTDDITDAWNNSPAIREVRNRYTIPLRRIPECADCPWVDYCNGGCPGITMQLRRTIAAPGRDGCYRDFLKANGIAGMNQAGVRA